jgi:hypothetical protein
MSVTKFVIAQLIQSLSREYFQIIKSRTVIISLVRLFAYE